MGVRQPVNVKRSGGKAFEMPDGSLSDRSMLIPGNASGFFSEIRAKLHSPDGGHDYRTAVPSELSGPTKRSRPGAGVLRSV